MMEDTGAQDIAEITRPYRSGTTCSRWHSQHKYFITLEESSHNLWCLHLQPWPLTAWRRLLLPVLIHQACLMCRIQLPIHTQHSLHLPGHLLRQSYLAPPSHPPTLLIQTWGISALPLRLLLILRALQTDRAHLLIHQPLRFIHLLQLEGAMGDFTEIRGKEKGIETDATSTHRMLLWGSTVMMG